MAKIINHPNYDRTKINNDVSVVFLANSIPESANIKYAAIATSVPAQQTNLVVSGFGLTQSGSASSELLKVTVPVQADSVCSIASTESNMKFCAGDPPSGKDSVRCIYNVKYISAKVILVVLWVALRVTPLCCTVL